MIDKYKNIISLVERLHRHFLDVLRVELHNQNINDINSVQALLLSNVGTEEVVIRDLKDRGYYHGSNVSYNIKKLTESGYIAQQRSKADRRAIKLRLTEKGLNICNIIEDLHSRFAQKFSRDEETTEKFLKAHNAMEEMEYTFNDFIRYGNL